MWAKKAASNEIPQGWYILGKLYQGVNGIPENPKLSHDFLLMAAENNHMLAQCEVGNNYRKSYGTSKNMSEAMSWYEASANNGYDACMYNTAQGYYFGAGVDKDIEKSIYWATKASATHAKAKAFLDKIQNNQKSLSTAEKRGDKP